MGMKKAKCPICKTVQEVSLLDGKTVYRCKACTRSVRFIEEKEEKPVKPVELPVEEEKVEKSGKIEKEVEKLPEEEEKPKSKRKRRRKK